MSTMESFLDITDRPKIELDSVQVDFGGDSISGVYEILAYLGDAKWLILCPDTLDTYVVSLKGLSRWSYTFLQWS